MSQLLPYMKEILQVNEDSYTLQKGPTKEDRKEPIEFQEACWIAKLEDG